jgi:hypothetical protein
MRLQARPQVVDLPIGTTTITRGEVEGLADVERAASPFHREHVEVVVMVGGKTTTASTSMRSTLPRRRHGRGRQAGDRVATGADVGWSAARSTGIRNSFGWDA